MSRTNRPSKHEICKKIKDALESLTARRIMFGTNKHLPDDMDGLEMESEADLPPLLIKLLNEINEAGPLECYAGTRPPLRSYEPEIHRLELWAYSWQSKQCGKKMYLKFALKKEWYVYVDCHPDRPRRD